MHGLRLLTPDTPPAAEWAPCAKCEASYRPTVLVGGLCPDCEALRRRDEYQATPAYREQWLEAAGVPKLYRRPFDRARTVRHVDRAKLSELGAWKGEPSILLMVGPRGTGKSMLAVEMAWRLRAETRGGTRWATAEQAIDDELASDEAGRARKAANRACACLVIDDLGVGHGGAAWSYALALISWRYADCRPTIITSMLDLDEIRAADTKRDGISVNEALADRLRDALIVPFSGPSERGA